jgi:hypothetical protein
MSELPPILYHYTSIDAFKGIIDNKHLRMTRHDQLNDPSEVKFTLDMIFDFLKQFKCNTRQPELKEILLEFLPHYRKLPLYITSFSKLANHLEQWRAYTPLGGVSIGFRSKELNKGYYFDIIPDGEEIRDGVIASDSNAIYKGEKIKNYHGVRPPYGIWQCRYISKDDEFKSQRIEQHRSVLTKAFIEKNVLEWFSESNVYTFELAKNHPESNLAQQVPRSLLNTNVLRLASATKHSSYAGEKEWRWVDLLSKEENFPLYLDEKNRLYIKAGIKPENFIKEVWISPHGDTEGLKRAVEFYKEKYKLDFKIHESKIPYRL